MAETRSQPLSEAERERLRQEMLVREELRVELEASARESLRSRGRWAFLRGAGFATVIGSLGLNLFGVIRAHFEKRQAQAQARLQKEIEIASTFADDMTRAGSLHGSFVALRTWLQQTKDQGDDVRNENGIPRSIVLQQYTDVWRMMMQTRSEGAILSQIDMFFDGGDIDDLIKQENSLIDATHHAKSREEVLQLSEKRHEVEGKLADALETHIKDRTR